jgi:hypothetical protein
MPDVAQVKHRAAESAQGRQLRYDLCTGSYTALHLSLPMAILNND